MRQVAKDELLWDGFERFKGRLEQCCILNGRSFSSIFIFFLYGLPYFLLVMISFIYACF